MRSLIGLLTELPGLYNRMRALEYLDFFGAVQGMPPDVRRARADDMLQQFDLGYARDRRLGEYSKGMRQKVALIRTLLHDPLVVFLDEPTSAMDPQSAKMVRDCHRRPARQPAHCRAVQPQPGRGREPGRPHRDHQARAHAGPRHRRRN